MNDFIYCSIKFNKEKKSKPILKLFYNQFFLKKIQVSYFKYYKDLFYFNFVE
jgi:hypothetical protein